MFYDGDLQSGIALAVKDSKSVACFVKGFLILQSPSAHALTDCILCSGRRIEFTMGERVLTGRSNQTCSQFKSSGFPYPRRISRSWVHGSILSVTSRSGIYRHKVGLRGSAVGISRSENTTVSDRSTVAVNLRSICGPERQKTLSRQQY